MTTRRDFLAAAGGAAGMALLGQAVLGQSLEGEPGQAGSGTTVLFQGDSITDWGRDKKNEQPNNTSALGGGYALLIASALLEELPGRGLRFYNRGVSGNTVPDLAARWDPDTIALKPDVLSILVGVNDIWHRFDGTFNGTVDDYRRDYAALLARTRAALPHVRLVVLEPFVLRTGAVNDRWFPEFDERRAAAAEVARGAHATFVPLQAAFDARARQAPPSYWTGDGVHPTPAGFELMAREWMRRVKV